MNGWGDYLNASTEERMGTQKTFGHPPQEEDDAIPEPLTPREFGQAIGKIVVIVIVACFTIVALSASFRCAYWLLHVAP